MFVQSNMVTNISSVFTHSLQIFPLTSYVSFPSLSENVSASGNLGDIRQFFFLVSRVETITISVIAVVSFVLLCPPDYS